MQKLTAALLLLSALWTEPLSALSPEKRLSQYSRTDWTQADGLPQDTIRATVQTTDGYLWVATEEGLSRFDGYEFTSFNREKGNLPSNAISSLAAGPEGDLWIGSSAGLTHYKNHRFETATKRQGLPDDDVSLVIRDRSGLIWGIAGLDVFRIENGRVITFKCGVDLPLSSVRTLYEDSDGGLWLAGVGGVARWRGGKFQIDFPGRKLSNGAIDCLLRDRHGNLWLGGSALSVVRANGYVEKYSPVNGIIGYPVRALMEDREGNIWIGTSDGLSRIHDQQVDSLAIDTTRLHDRVRSLYEDRSGDVWMGTNSGLVRFIDSPFTLYSKDDGMPSNEATTVFENRDGVIWIGYRNAGLVSIQGDRRRIYNPSNSSIGDFIYSIHENDRGDLLVSNRAGLSIIRRGNVISTTPAPYHSIEAKLVFDALEDHWGRVWIVNGEGLSQLVGGTFHSVVPTGNVPNEYMMILREGVDSDLWVGTRANGLWHLKDGKIDHVTVADGLSSNQICALQVDSDGTLWIGTSGGGLDRLKNGRFFQYGRRHGLPSEYIFDIAPDHRDAYWFSTSQGIFNLSKQDLESVALGKLAVLSPEALGVEHGLRNAQCGPGYPFACVAASAKDGRFWFPTNRGVAVFNPRQATQKHSDLQVHIVGMRVGPTAVVPDGSLVLPAGSSDIQIRYAAIHLSSPEGVNYSYKLEGVDQNWVAVGRQRSVTYTNLGVGHYRFKVRSSLKNSPASETAMSFEILPHFYQTLWFRLFAALTLLAAMVLAYRLRLRQISARFALVIEERGRIARELHDTLAQSFVGISSQLEAVDACLDLEPKRARDYLRVARGLTRHSLHEARRTLMDLRSRALDEMTLPAALEMETRRWTAGSSIRIQTDIVCESHRVPREIEQNLLRIAQEAVTNAIRHSSAESLKVVLKGDATRLTLQISDDGRGCQKADLYSPEEGHFGLIGMRERAQSIGGDFQFDSRPEAGTSVIVTVPLN